MCFRHQNKYVFKARQRINKEFYFRMCSYVKYIVCFVKNKPINCYPMQANAMHISK